MRFPFRLGERFKGVIDVLRAGKGGAAKNYQDLSWERRCKWADSIFNNHNLAKSQVLTIAGQLLANDIFLESAGEYDRAEEAKNLCDKLNRDVKMRLLIYESAIPLAKYGSVFWEKTWEPTFNARLIPRQELIQPAEVDPVMGVIRWKHVYNNVTIAEWEKDEIINVAWNITSQSWPYGTSLYVGLENEFDTLSQMELDIKEYAHKSAFPNDIIGFGGDANFAPSDTDVAAIKTKVNQLEPGDRLVTNYPLSKVSSGVGERDIRNVDTILSFLKDNITDGLMMPPISKQYNATEASAKVMMPWAHANLVQPMQWLFDDAIENEVYKPYLVSQGYSVKVVPSVLWEAPDANKLEDAEYWRGLVQAGICPPKYAAEQVGIPAEEFDAWQLEKQKLEAERMQVNKLNQPQQQGEGKRWEVKEIG